MRLKEKNLLQKFAATLKKFSAQGAKKVEYGSLCSFCTTFTIIVYGFSIFSGAIQLTIVLDGLALLGCVFFFFLGCDNLKIAGATFPYFNRYCGQCSPFHYWSLYTVKILKFGTPQTNAIIVLKIEKFDVTLH